MSTERVMEGVVDRENLRAAYRAVRRNRGSAGVDGRSIEATAAHLRAHWPGIEAKLNAGTYRPSPVRGVRIPKASGGERLLGIPTVQDRLIQQALSQVLGARLDVGFSEHSYGFRPGRSAHDAVRAGREYVRLGKSWVVDLDLSNFFDEVDHDLLMHRLGREVRDKRVLRLVGRYLRAPLVVDGQRVSRRRGTPQGGPLSPLLANLYLDPLDRELERRGLSFCRYADDVVIYAGSERSAERILVSITAWIERHLKLTVNRAKSGTGRPWERAYLGFTLLGDGRIALAARSIERLKQAVRAHWDARQSLTSVELVERWRRYLRGWCNYFALAQARSTVYALEGWIRRHMRKCFWLRWHNRVGRLRALQRLGARPYHWGVASSRRGAWRLARGPVLQTVLSSARLERHGLWVPSSLWTT